MTGGPQVLAGLLELLPFPEHHKWVFTQKESPLTRRARDLNCPVHLFPSLGGYTKSISRASMTSRFLLLIFPFLWIRLACYIIRVLKREKPDIAWVRNSKTAFPLLPLFKILKIPFIWDIGMEKPSRGIYKIVHHCVFKQCCAVVVEGRAVLPMVFTPSQIVRFRHKIQVIPSGIHPERVREIEKAINRFSNPDPFTILNVGGICRRKNQGALLQAVEPILEKYPNLRVQLAGGIIDETYYAKLQRDHKKFIGEGRIVILGWREDIPELMGQADLLVHVAENEGVPYTLLEAIHSRLPIVAVNSGGIADLIQDRVNGFIVTPDDRNALRDRIEECIGSCVVRDALAEKATETVEKRYNLENWISSYARLIEKLARAD